jgi:hypothetical protein
VPASFYSVAHFYTVQESINLSKKAGFHLETIFSTLFERPGKCGQFGFYPPLLGGIKEAGFVCIKMKKDG